MSDHGSKHDKVMNRVHLWVAVLGGIVTLSIGIYNFRAIYFPNKAASKPAAEVSADSVQRPPVSSIQNRSLSFESFLSWDQNGDGKVRETEWRGSRQSLDLFDLDSNGVLTTQDFKGTGFETMDTSGDGFIVPLEWRKSRRAFQIFDDNSDGRISHDEFAVRDAAVAELFNRNP